MLAKPSIVSSVCSSRRNRSSFVFVWPTPCVGSLLNDLRRKSAADARLCWKSWEPAFEPKKALCRVRLKAGAFSKSLKQVIHSAGALLTKRFWKHMNKESSLKKQRCSIAPDVDRL